MPSRQVSVTTTSAMSRLRNSHCCESVSSASKMLGSPARRRIVSIHGLLQRYTAGQVRTEEFVGDVAIVDVVLDRHRDALEVVEHLLEVGRERPLLFFGERHVVLRGVVPVGELLQPLPHRDALPRGVVQRQLDHRLAPVPVVLLGDLLVGVLDLQLLLLDLSLLLADLAAEEADAGHEHQQRQYLHQQVEPVDPGRGRGHGVFRGGDASTLARQWMPPARAPHESRPIPPFRRRIPAFVAHPSGPAPSAAMLRRTPLAGRFPVIKSLFFLLRIVAAWMLLFLLAAALWSSLPLIGHLEGPVVLASGITLAFVLTGAFSHLRRVRLIAGRRRQRRAGQPPAPPDRDPASKPARPSTCSTPRSANCRGIEQRRERARQPAGARQARSARPLRRAAARPLESAVDGSARGAQPDPGDGHARRTTAAA